MKGEREGKRERAKEREKEEKKEKEENTQAGSLSLFYNLILKMTSIISTISSLLELS